MSADRETENNQQSIEAAEGKTLIRPALAPVHLGNTAETPAVTDEDQTQAGGSGGVATDFARNIPFLRVIHPREFTQRIRLNEGTMIIGRGQNADIILHDSQVSRIHSKITYSGGKIFVEDLGSTNGTLLDGRPVKLDSLTIHSRLQIGRFVLKAEFKDPDEISYDDKILAAATTDSLTGVPNRQWLLEQGVTFLKAFKENKRLLSAVMIDVDHFKRVNDEYGHQAGDQVLCDVAAVLQKNKRELDLLGRYGGEEFLMFLPHTQHDEAEMVCQRIRSAIEEHVSEFEGHTIKVTISVGVASESFDALHALDGLIRRADDALYEAKREGRNRVVVSQ